MIAEILSMIKKPTGVKCFRFFIGMILVLFLAAGRALAGPPLITDDPDTPGPNSWEIDVATTSAYVQRTWDLETPLLDINYGIGDHIELTCELPWEVTVPDHGGTDSGLGNTLLGVKWRFLDQTNAWLDVSAYPQVEFNNPTASVRHGLANDGTTVLLPFEVGHRFGPLDIYADTAYVWNQRQVTGGFCGVAAEYELSENFSVMAELHDDFETHLTNNELDFNLGFRRTLTEHISLIGSAGRAIFGPSQTAPGFMSYLALEFTF
jgi:hypothetical protein